MSVARAQFGAVVRRRPGEGEAVLSCALRHVTGRVDGEESTKRLPDINQYSDGRV